MYVKITKEGKQVAFYLQSLHNVKSEKLRLNNFSEMFIMSQ